MGLTPEQRQKAVGAESAEALLDLALAEGVALSPAEAKSYLGRLHPPGGELSRPRPRVGIMHGKKGA